MNATDAFVLQTMDLDGVSVSREDGAIVVACRDHDGVDEIETEDVHDKIAEHGFRVENTIGDFSAGELRLEVTERD